MSNPGYPTSEHGVQLKEMDPYAVQPTPYTTQPGAQGPPGYNQMHFQQGPIVTQPGAVPVPGAAVAFVPPPAPMQGVPPGLEYLTMVDNLTVHQIYEILEIVTNWEVRNKYSLRNSEGQQVYYAFEESTCFQRQCCSSQRGFTMHIVDNFNREVIRIERPFKCCAMGCFCFQCCDPCQSECLIESPPGILVGRVKQRCSCCVSAFTIQDAEGNDIFTTEGPCCVCHCSDQEFPITASANGQVVGAVTKKWGGCLREAFTDADIFAVSFPRDLDIHMKAVLLGATFLIDFVNFENNQNKNNGGG